MNDKKSAFSSLAASAVLQPMEAMLEVKKQSKELYIGIPKETSFQENRVPLIPESVSLLTNNGHQIVIEAGAGAAAKFGIQILVKRVQKLPTPQKRYIRPILF
ncbi:MAG: hypothetical protein U0X76_09185 [Bacteroidia bacterium]